PTTLAASCLLHVSRAVACAAHDCARRDRPLAHRSAVAAAGLLLARLPCSAAPRLPGKPLGPGSLPSLRQTAHLRPSADAAPPGLCRARWRAGTARAHNRPPV